MEKLIDHDDQEVRMMMNRYGYCAFDIQDQLGVKHHGGGYYVAYHHKNIMMKRDPKTEPMGKHQTMEAAIGYAQMMILGHE